MFQQVCWYGYLDRKCRDRQVNLIFDLLINNKLDSGQIGDLLELAKRILANTSDSHYKYWKQPCQELVEEELIQRHQLAVASIVWILVSGHGHWTLYIVTQSLQSPSMTICLACKFQQTYVMPFSGSYVISERDGGTAKITAVGGQEDGFSGMVPHKITCLNALDIKKPTCFGRPRKI